MAPACEPFVEEGSEGRTIQAFFGWDSAAPSPRHSPSPRETCDGGANQRAESAVADSKRIQHLKLDLSTVSTAAPSTPAEPAEASVPASGSFSPRKRASVKGSQSRFKLPLPKSKRNEKSYIESPSDRVDTPSTCAGTTEAGSPRWQGSKQTYADLAAELLEAGTTSLQRAGRDPHFSEALAAQGLVLHDLLPSSGLSVARRTNLLAAVLQEKDLASSSRMDSARGAKVLHSQLQQSVDELAGRILTHREHRNSVTKRNQNLAEETAEKHQERAQEELQRQTRVHQRDEAATAARRVRSRERTVQWQGAVTRGHENLEARVEERRTFLRQQDARVEQSLTRREEVRAAQRQQLQEHFQDVQQAGELSRHEAYARMLQQEENLQNALKRSEEHLEALRAAQERRLEQRQQESREREHEVLRVQRAQAYARQRKASQHEEDSALFKECVVLREHLSTLARSKVSELSHNSSTASGISR